MPLQILRRKSHPRLASISTTGLYAPAEDRISTSIDADIAETKSGFDTPINSSKLGKVEKMNNTQDKQESVAWRYLYKFSKKWTVQKNKPDWWREGMPDVTLERLYSASTVEALKAEKAHLLSRVEWRPIETAPKDGTAILIGHSEAAFSAWWQPDGERTDTGQPGWVDGSCNRYEEEYTYSVATHWMPLPKPPTALKEKSHD